MRRKLADALLVAAILLTVALLYRKVTRLWWIWDDTYLLHIASEHAPLDYFTKGDVWLSMPQQLFTPLLIASYDAELALFGPNPRPFYVAHLAELALLAVALAFTLRLWMSCAAAACAALLFLVGTPTAVMANELMLMHYVQSMILATGSAALFGWRFRAAEVQRCRVEPSSSEPLNLYTSAPLLASALFYLLAMLAKEIAVPLPAVLLVLPERDLRARVRALIAHAVALIVYLAWRSAILGKLVGGYAWTFGTSDALLLPLRTAWNVARTFAGPRLAIGIPLVLLVALGVLLRMRSRAAVAGVLVAFAVAIGPIVPVSIHYEHRFAWAAWTCAAILFAAGADTLRDRRLALALMLATPLLGIFVNRQQWKVEFNLGKRMSDEGHVFSDLEGGDFLRMPAIPPGEMFQLAWFKEFILHRAGGTMWFYDDLYLCAGAKPRRVFGFDARTHHVREMTDEMPAVAARYCASIRPNEPLQLRFRFDNARRLLTWDLGPYDDGYTVVVGNGFLGYDVRRRDGLQLFAEKGLAFKLRYRSPQGWVTYSPELSLDLTKDQDLVWKR